MEGDIRQHHVQDILLLTLLHHRLRPLRPPLDPLFQVMHRDMEEVSLSPDPLGVHTHHRLDHPMVPQASHRSRPRLVHLLDSLVVLGHLRGVILGLADRLDSRENPSLVVWGVDHPRSLLGPEQVPSSLPLVVGLGLVRTDMDRIVGMAVTGMGQVGK